MSGPVVLSIQPVAERFGSDRALLSLVSELSSAGWVCHVAMPGRSGLAAEFAAVGTRLHDVAMPRLTTSKSRSEMIMDLGRGWPPATLRLIRLGRELGVDVVHSNSLHSWYGWAVSFVLRRPHVWHAREIPFQSDWALILERWLARWGATSVIAISKAVADNLHERNVRVMFDEPDHSVFYPGRAGSFRGTCDIPDTAPVVGIAGRIDTWKGVDVFLDSVGLIRDVCPQAVAVVAGGAVEGKESYYQQMKERAESTPGVRWLGYRHDMPDVMADLDVLVLASTKPEPFGLVLVEALACGVRVVATEEGGPPEILAGAVPGAGLLVPSKDPAKLAAAVVALLPSGGSTTAARRRRSVLRRAVRPDFPAHFEAVSAGGRRSRCSRGSGSAG